MVELESVRRRLEFLLHALYNRPFSIAEAETKLRRRWHQRLRLFLSGELPTEGLASTDGSSLFLPGELDARHGREATEGHYRLLAIEQAERIVRNTAGHAPAEDDLLERELYLLSEAAAVDAALVHSMPGAKSPLAAARLVALEQRPDLNRLRKAERDVEMLVRQILNSDPASLPVALVTCNSATDSLVWARETAHRIREHRGGKSRYRGVRPVQIWGTLRSEKGRTNDLFMAEQPMDSIHHRIDLPIRGTRARDSRSGDPEGPEGLSETAQNLHEHPNGLSATSDNFIRSPTTSSERVSGEESHSVAQAAPTNMRPAPSPASGDDADVEVGIPYAEWDAGADRYRMHGVLVRPSHAAESDAAWVTTVRSDHAPLVRRVHQRFELLRARRTHLGRQRDGYEPDLAACVDALVDRRTGIGASDRLYTAVRQARQTLAIALLVDVSGSTDTMVNSVQQVIDIEKIALVLASEALEALGDPYTILSFSSRGAQNVRVTRIKDFLEAYGEPVRRRIPALCPGGNTRLGAAVRHATALLGRQPARHRLLLILSDGRPNDRDGYHEEYGVEDTRQAIFEARSQSVFPFCLTIDREGASYLPRIFGIAGHTVLRKPDQLPLALLQVVRHLLAC